MTEWIAIGLMVLILGFFFYKVYKHLYKELCDIHDEMGPEIRPIISYSVAVNYPKNHREHSESNWHVGFTILEGRDGNRTIEFTGHGAEQYFLNKDKIYARYGVPLLKNAKVSQIPKHIDGIIFYE